MPAFHLVGAITPDQIPLVRRLVAEGWNVRSLRLEAGDVVAFLPGVGAGTVTAIDEVASQSPPVRGPVPLGSFVNSMGMCLIPVPDGIFVGPTGIVVPVCGLLMAEFPVTNHQYGMFLHDSGYQGEADCPGIDIYRTYDGRYLQVLREARPGFSDPDAPVVCVSWFNALACAEFLTRKERAEGRIEAPWHYRLPTEAEWEYVAQMGMDSSVVDPARCNLAEAVGHPTPLGRYPADRSGFFDLLGNVFEWCANAADLSQQGVVATRETVAYRANRGGSWASAKESCSPAYRHWNQGDSCHNRLGFRLVLTSE